MFLLLKVILQLHRPNSLHRHMLETGLDRYATEILMQKFSITAGRETIHISTVFSRDRSLMVYVQHGITTIQNHGYIRFKLHGNLISSIMPIL